MLLFFLACVTKPPTNPYVRKIRIEGNGNLFEASSDFSLRNAMVQQQSDSFVWFDPQERGVELSQRELRLDAWRIESWYAKRGYLDARFSGWEIIELPKNPFWPVQMVDIVGHIDEGPETNVRSIRIKGLSERQLRITAREALEMEVGDPIHSGSLEDAESIMLEELRNRSFARASVSARAKIWPANCAESARAQTCRMAVAKAACANWIEQPTKYPTRNKTKRKDVNLFCKNFLKSEGDCIDKACVVAPPSLLTEDSEWPFEVPEIEGHQFADVVFDVRPNRAHYFGEVTVLSAMKIPFENVINSKPFSTGDAFSTSKVSVYQRKLFGLNQFSVVRVVPDYEVTGTTIPVSVVVAEREPREINAGVGGTFASGITSSFVGFNFDHNNVFNRLTSLSWYNTFGYALYSDATTIGDVFSSEVLTGFGGPTISSDLQLQSSPTGDWRWSIGVHSQTSLEVNYNYRDIAQVLGPSVGFKIPLPFERSQFKFIDIGLGYDWEAFRFLEFRDPEVIGDLPLTFQLAKLKQQVTLDGRNDPIDTRQGTYVKLEFSEATKWLGGSYDFLTTGFDFRTFYQLRNLFNMKFGSSKSLRRQLWDRGWKLDDPTGVVAFRFAWGGVHAVPNSDEPPISENLFLGGSNSVRGWRNNILGPYVCSEPGCVVDGVQQKTSITPIGGRASLLSSFEYRHYLMDSYSAVLFFDAGQIWSTVSSVNLAGIETAVGLGARWVSPVGPVRLDIARRINENPLFAVEEKWAAHLALSSPF